MHKLKEPISLARDYSNDGPVSPNTDGLHLSLPDISELQGLPASGTITFRYTRERLSLPKDNKLSADLCLCEILDVKGDKVDEEKTEDTVDALFAEAQKSSEEEKD
jgi:hypothetical protein